MKKPNAKLLAATSLALIAITLMVTASYAWLNLSGSPALTGIQINIGGKGTIMIAPNVSEDVDGETVNYPGKFTETLNLAYSKNYSYLGNLAGLKPVSTSDGINWFMYPASLQGDEELTPESYTRDSVLKYANVLSGEMSEDELEGSYVYLDFWVVSPLDNCSLRISAANETEGSYCMALPKVEKDTTSDSGFVLKEDDEAAAAVRVGFLVNSQNVTDSASMTAYARSDCYLEEYSVLKGNYPEKNQAVSDESAYNFTIYEPNGDKHNNIGVSYVLTDKGLTYTSCSDGDYAVTRPIGFSDGQAVISDVSDILTVQKSNTWKTDANGETLLSQMFQSVVYGMRNETGISQGDIMNRFYEEALKGTYTAYLNRGKFFNNTKLLYYAGNGTVTTQKDMRNLEYNTCTGSAVVVKLEKDVPQRIRMFVWLEGQDIDCVREASLESLAIGIEFAGSTND